MSLKAILPPGVRQKHIAVTLNVSEPVVSRWMRGTLDVPTRHIPALAKLLNVPVAVVVEHAINHHTVEAA